MRNAGHDGQAVRHARRFQSHDKESHSMFRSTLPVFLAFLFFSALPAHANYSQGDLNRDFKLATEMGVFVFDVSRDLSRALSDRIAPAGKPRATFRRSELSVIPEEINAVADRDIPAAIAREVRLVGRMDPSATLTSYPSPDPAQPWSTRTESSRSQRGGRQEMSLVAGPVARPGIENYLRIQKAFVGRCSTMAVAMLTSGDPVLVDAFVALLKDPANKSTRWLFAGIADLVANLPTTAHLPPAVALKDMLATLHEEAKENAATINWNFGSVLTSNSTAAAEFKESARRTSATLRPSAPARSAPAAGRSAGNEITLTNQQKRGFFNNMWEDITGHADENWNMGSQVGTPAGMYVGAVGGFIAGGAALGPGGAGVGMLEGFEMGEAIGQVAGGVAGVIGGTIGTAAGWFVGAAESWWANRGGPSRSSRGPVASSSTLGNDGEVSLWLAGLDRFLVPIENLN
jgi:hypothetical protein